MTEEPSRIAHSQEAVTMSSMAEPTMQDVGQESDVPAIEAVDDEKTHSTQVPQDVDANGQDVDATGALDIMSEQRPKQTEFDFPHSIIPMRPKILLMLTAAFSTMISPLSSTIYLPALNDIAVDLDVSISLMNLTISMYLIFQAISPSVTAAFGESFGRRPAYLGCFVVYLGANIGLALQHSYPALMVLRCLQSAGSSGTVALAAGTIADLSTRAERGKYIAYVTMGVTVGPVIGPIIGGAITAAGSWRWIFWFLTIFCAFFGTLMAIVFCETQRAIVGNGSIPPQRWNRSLLQVINEDIRKNPLPRPDVKTLQTRKKHPNPLASITILRERENFLITVFVAVLYAGYLAVSSTFSSQLEARYHFSSVQIGLCYIALGTGSLSSRWTVATALDWNFRRQAKMQGLAIVKNRQQDIANFNIEAARLQVTAPVLAGAAVMTLVYGWVMEFKLPLPAVLVAGFFLTHFLSGTMMTTNALLVDINRTAPATAQAANNLCRCLLAAAAVAVATPIIDAIGIGWMATIFVLVWLLCAPCVWLVYSRGHKWRLARAGERKVDRDGRTPGE